MRYFDELLSKIKGKLSGWKCEMISLAARKVLLQSVLNVMLWFILANSLVLKGVLDTSEKELSSFLVV